VLFSLIFSRVLTLNLILFHHSGLFYGRLLLQSLLLSGLFHVRLATAAAKTSFFNWFRFFWFLMLKNRPEQKKIGSV